MGNFQNIFRKLRTSSNLTQNAIAEKLGISRSTIGMYETGAREPDFETLEKIADYFNVDTDFLLGRTNQTTMLPETVGKYSKTRELDIIYDYLLTTRERFSPTLRTFSPPSRWKKIFLQLMPEQTLSKHPNVFSMI